MPLTRLLERPLLASYFIVSGAHAFRNASTIAPQTKPVTDRIAPAAEQAVHRVAPQAQMPSDPATWVRIGALVQVAAAGALATGKFPRVASAVLAASLVPSTAVAHRFWEEPDPDRRREQQRHFLKSASLVGGLLIAAGDTAGKPGLAWRARHATKDLGREAKLAKAQVAAAVH